MTRDGFMGSGQGWHIKYHIPDNVRCEPRQERSQVTLCARLLEPNFQPFRRDTRTRGERMPTLNPRPAILAREEADVVPDLGERDVGYDPRNLRVESESGEYFAHARYG